MFSVFITSHTIAILNETSEQLNFPKIANLGVSMMELSWQPNA